MSNRAGLNASAALLGAVILVTLYLHSADAAGCLTVRDSNTGIRIVDCNKPQRSPINFYEVFWNTNVTETTLGLAYHNTAGDSSVPSDPTAVFYIGNTVRDSNGVLTITQNPASTTAGAFSPDSGNPTWADVSVRFDCSTDQLVQVAFAFSIRAESVNNTVIVNLVKDCTSPVCATDTCSTEHGACAGNTCVCDGVGYTTDVTARDCGTYLDVSPRVACPMDNLTVT